MRFHKTSARVSLDAISTRAPRHLDRAAAEQEMPALEARLGGLQELLWGAKTHSLLVVLQGRDTAGKDGTIKKVAGAFNPRGVSVVSFGVPSEEELAHDFLWRVHRHAPRRGEVAIFNRSHYEDVLVVRVHGLVPEKVWQRRYAHINDFEGLLAEHGTIIVKIFLHISKEEQEERLRAREEDPAKAWKLNPGDWREREYWKPFSRAYEDALARCARPHAPWYIVPADQKWFRNLAVAEVLCKTLEPFREEWQEVLRARSRAAQKALSSFHGPRKKQSRPVRRR